MSEQTTNKKVIFIRDRMKTPPFSPIARGEAGRLLRRLQGGIFLSMPHSRPLPVVGERCHELRVRDETQNWRIIYRIDLKVIIVAVIFAKQGIPQQQRFFKVARQRFAKYDDAVIKGKST